MPDKVSRSIKLLLLCFVCNGISFTVFLTGAARPVSLGVGIALTLILWLLLVYMVGDRRREITQPITQVVVPEAPETSGGAIRMLAALQREGRLIDFLQEDLSAYEDGQIGAAVRNIHRGCKEILKEQMEIQPIFKDKEGSIVTIPAGFDRAAIRLTGKVTGDPPFRGILRHRGWTVESIRVPLSQQPKDDRILAPAEVEIE